MAIDPTGSSDSVASTVHLHGDREIDQLHVLVGIEAGGPHHVSRDRPPLDARHVAERLAAEVGKSLDRTIRLDDQAVIDPVDGDAAALQSEHPKLSRKLRFRDHGDAGGSSRRSEVGALRDQRIDDLVRRFHLVGVELDASLFKQ